MERFRTSRHGRLAFSPIAKGLGPIEAFTCKMVSQGRGGNKVKIQGLQGEDQRRYVG